MQFKSPVISRSVPFQIPDLPRQDAQANSSSTPLQPIQSGNRAIALGITFVPAVTSDNMCLAFAKTTGSPHLLSFVCVQRNSFDICQRREAPAMGFDARQSSGFLGHQGAFCFLGQAATLRAAIMTIVFRQSCRESRHKSSSDRIEGATDINLGLYWNGGSL
jgi:hypothetical protein